MDLVLDVVKIAILSESIINLSHSHLSLGSGYGSVPSVSLGSLPMARGAGFVAQDPVPAAPDLSSFIV